MDWNTCFKGKKILVAEDDALTREMMQDILTGMNCSADFAVDGADAVSHVNSNSYDLILMDIRMPNKDGITAMKEIRAIENGNKRTPIIALTASLLNEERQNCVAAGADDFIIKPIHLQELRSKMQKFLLGKL